MKRCRIGIIVAGAALVSASVYGERVKHPAKVYPPDAIHAVSRRAHVGIPSFAASTKNNRMWACWYGGITPEEDENNYVVLATSADDGRTWKEVLVCDPDLAGPRRTFDAELWISPDGRLRWTWTDRIGTGTSDPTDDQLWMLTLDAENEPPEELPEPTYVGRGVMMCKPTVLANGEMLFPSAWFQLAPSARFYATRDCHRFEMIGGATVPDGQRICDEHQVVQLKNGDLWCLIRGLNGLWESRSTDNGRTWSEAKEPAGIRHTSSRHFLHRLASGNLLLVKHGPVDRDVGRKELAAYVSRDDGKTWSKGLMLDAREGVSYPDGQQLADGRIAVVYDYNRVTDREVHLVLFTEADALAGAADRIVRRLVTKSSTDPLDELLPQPKAVVRAGATADVSVLRQVKEKTGEIAGVPSHLREEAYRIEIGARETVVTAPHARGFRYARVTLEQLERLCDRTVPCGTIEDWPTFAWRGVMHDCGRNYLSMEGVKAILDMMARYKFNLFHWHLTDYYGWRLESKRHPMLQAPWAFRRQVGKYYTQKDFREILDYAAARGITVMPEFDVPGHTLAFRRGLDIAFMNDPKAHEAVGDLLDELCSLATPREMPFVHLGTDEARTSYEMVQPTKVSSWAERLCKAGRTPVAWTPGIPFRCSRPWVRMFWGTQDDREHAGDFTDPAGVRAFDSARFYFGSVDPFTLLSVATAARPCNWAGSDANRLGPVMCCWHDDFLGEDTLNLFRNVPFFPAVVAYSDMFWNSREREDADHLRNLPPPDTPAFERVCALERRILAQRERVLADFRHPFQYVRQTDLRWRVTDEAGRVIARELAGGTIWFGSQGGLSSNRTGRITMTTRIKSPDDREIGCWIGFMSYHRSGGRGCSGLPEPGRWKPKASGEAVVRVNGDVVQPPEWGFPGPVEYVVHPEEPTSSYVAEMPFANEEYFMRAPTRIRLRAGWNDVRIDVEQRRAGWSDNWLATFVPVAGDSAHPHEENGLVFRATE